MFQSINCLPNPACLPTDSSIMTYREDLLQDVINYFKDTTQTKLYLDRMASVYLDLKLLLKDQERCMSRQEICTFILNYYTDQFQTTLWTYTCISSDQCSLWKRYLKNHIKTNCRSKLTPDIVAKLVRIQEEGLEQEDFDPTESLHNFMGIRDRRKWCEPWSSDLQTRCLLFYIWQFM